MISRIADIGLWREGTERIAWARRFMPATTAIGAELARSGALAGIRVAVSDVLEPKTATVALTLAEAGAQVVVSCEGRNTDDAVAAALVHAGIPVYAFSAASDAEDLENTLSLLDHRPQVIVDDGSHTIRVAHTMRAALLAGVIGATEQTTSGVRALRTMESAGELLIPVVAGNDARTKSLFDNAHGTGQAVVFAIADLIDESLAGSHVVVAGFGRVGSGIARHAAALGARVTVSEVDPVAALQASFAGFAVAPLAQAARSADILISASGVAGTVDLDHLRLLPEGAVVAVGGGVEQEIALQDAAARGATLLRRERAVAWWRIAGGATVRVLDDGHCINVSAAEGNPVQIMDLTFGVQLSAVGHVIARQGDLAPGVHDLPRELDDGVAAAALAAFGASIDTRTSRQLEHLHSWRPGDVSGTGDSAPTSEDSHDSP